MNRVGRAASRASLGALSALLILSGCDFTLVVDVDSDLVPGEEGTRIRNEIFRGDPDPYASDGRN